MDKKLNSRTSAYTQCFSELEEMAESFLIDSGLVLKREYAGDTKSFIYEYLKIDTVIGRHQKTIVKQSNSITVYSIEGIKQTKVFMLSLEEYSYEVYQKVLISLRSMAKSNVVCCFLDEKKSRYALCGKLYSTENETANLIISDWFFDYGISTVTGDVFHIDFSECGCEESEFYTDFLYLIARPYVRYSESKMFLSMGGNNYWIFSDDIDDFIWVREELVENNNRYYSDLSQEDFFDDASDYENDIEEFEDVEFDESDDLEWTLLEMQLEKELEDDEFFDEESEDIITDEIDMPKDLSPLQMLEYIKTKKTINKE